jgi:hypothetical protein
MRTSECPFGDHPPYLTTYCAAISGHHECLYPTYFEYENDIIKRMIEPQLTECRIIQRLIRAFQAKDFEVIRYYFYRLNYEDKEWHNFVKETSGKLWPTWKILLGKYLSEKCKNDNNCPYKPLLK